MNTTGRETDDEPSSRTNEESSSLSAHNNSLNVNEQQQLSSTSGQARNNSVNGTNAAQSAAAATLPEMKRSAVKELIERYFYQLQRGCGNPNCVNKYCASSGQVPSMTPNEIAGRAIQLFSQDAQLCDFESQPSKVPRTKINDTASSSQTTASSPESDNSSSSSSSDSSSLPSTILMCTTSPNNSSSSSDSGSVNSATSIRYITESEDEDHYTAAAAAATPAAPRTTSTTITTPTVSNTTIRTALTRSGSNSSNPYSWPIDTAASVLTASAVQAVPRTTIATTSVLKSSSINTPTNASSTSNCLPSSIDANTRLSTTPTPTPDSMPIQQYHYINELMLDDLIDECQKINDYDRLINVIEDVFASTDKLGRSFMLRKAAKSTCSTCHRIISAKLHELLGKSPNKLKKEDLRTLEGEADKDEDSSIAGVQEDDENDEHRMDETEIEPAAPLSLLSSTAPSSSSSATMRNAANGKRTPPYAHCDIDATFVDLESLRRSKKKLFSIDNPRIGEAITSAVLHLADAIKYRLESDWEKVMHCLVICFDMAASSFYNVAEQEYLECAFLKICHAARVLSVTLQARLAHIWATHCKEQLLSMVRSCQQLITMQVYMDEDGVQDSRDVIAVTKILKIVFYANILAGQCEQPKTYTANMSDGAAGGDAQNTIDDDDIDVFSYTQVPKPHYPKFVDDKLEVELGVTCMDCREPFLPFEEFYNEPLSDAIQMDRDYLSYKSLSLDPLSDDSHFSYMLYSFILTPATKVIALYYDSRIRMYSERNSSLFSLLNYFGDNNDVGSRPDLKLKVRRDNIIDDALIGLEMVAMGNPKDLKKQLVVEFVGEEGIDEGGVSKEFFQLIVEELFNPDFGMFTHQEDTKMMWFNSSPFENEAQFTLIGIILGLAIYNNIILAVHFPMVVYRKLMGGQGTFFDLADWNPRLYRSLKFMLDYEEPDMEDVFMQTFKISYNNMFGELIDHELKPGGRDIIVGQHNKQEFVDLYSDFLLNKSIERQFRAFKRGFEMVTDESPLKLLFRPEEIELLVCGSRKFDFVELEQSTEYEGGYTKDTPIIKYFWSVVHSMPEESKRKLLEFTTGSDRIPVGGLSRLKLLITRHGPDSERLPTSHTCFNVLLLPEYSSKEKLEERLLKAINYSKGFGML